MTWTTHRMLKLIQPSTDRPRTICSDSGARPGISAISRTSSTIEAR